MDQIAQSWGRNRLLSMATAEDYALLRPYAKRAHYRSGEAIFDQGAPIDLVCFPEGGVAAYLAVAADGNRSAVGVTGREGLIGVGTLFGQSRWPHQVVLRGCDATGLVIEADRLLQVCRNAPGLHTLLLRFAGNLMLQISRSCTVNLTAPLTLRLARWLLLYHDRLEGDEFAITHEELGIMLGVRRASATEGLHMLEGTGAIRSLRGRVVVRDRRGLEQIAAEAYGDAELDYREKLGPFGKTGPVPDCAEASAVAAGSG